jgi:hypothetical protein
MFNLNINTLCSFPLGFKEPSSYAYNCNTVVTSVKTDYDKNESEVEFFIRGD